MCIICGNEDLDGLKTLDCSDCPLLTNIPQINGLQTLSCYNCPLLTSVPRIDGLRKLYCFKCPLLTNIPLINSLQTLICRNCPLLTNIPHINGLQTLYCCQCHLLTNIPQINGLRRLSCYGCRSLTGLNITSDFQFLQTNDCIWLSNHPDFNESIKKLIKLQKWFKRLYLGKKLRKLIPQLIPLYYHPDAKGGYFDKLEIVKFVRDLLQDPCPNDSKNVEFCFH
jgi:uncharacterized paraquat-inducible protein A